MCIDESSPKYPLFLSLQETLIGIGAEHDTKTLTMFVFGLFWYYEAHPSVDRDSFLFAVTAGWNKFQSLSIFPEYEKFYITGSFDD